MSSETMLSKSDALNQFGQAWRDFLESYHGGAMSEDDAKTEVEDQKRRLRITRLGSVAVISEDDLAKQYRESTEAYTRMFGPSGWHDAATHHAKKAVAQPRLTPKISNGAESMMRRW